MSLNIPTGGGDMGRVIFNQLVLGNIIAQANSEQQNNAIEAQRLQYEKDTQVGEENEASSVQNENDGGGPSWEGGGEHGKKEENTEDQPPSKRRGPHGEGGLVDVTV